MIGTNVSKNGNGNNDGYDAQVSDSGGSCEIGSTGSDSYSFESLRQTTLKARAYKFDNNSVTGFAVYGSGIKFLSDYPEAAVYFCLQAKTDHRLTSARRSLICHQRLLS